MQQQHRATRTVLFFFLSRGLLWTTGGRYVFEKFLITDIEYLLQSDQIIYKNIPTSHLYERIGTAAEWRA